MTMILNKHPFGNHLSANSPLPLFLINSSFPHLSSRSVLGQVTQINFFHQTVVFIAHSAQLIKNHTDEMWPVTNSAHQSIMKDYNTYELKSHECNTILDKHVIFFFP